MLDFLEPEIEYILDNVVQQNYEDAQTDANYGEADTEDQGAADSNKKEKAPEGKDIMDDVVLTDWMMA